MPLYSQLAPLWPVSSSSSIYCIKERFLDYSEINLLLDGGLSHCLLCAYWGSVNNLLPAENGRDEVKDWTVFMAMSIFLEE